MLQERGTVIVLADTPSATWSIAKTLKAKENKRTLRGEELGHVQRFLSDEMGQDFPLTSLLEYGVGVHHAGMSEDTRSLVEWLTENDRLGVLVATTTIAQGVNFPVSGVVFASHQYRLREWPYRVDMPPEDFWNIAGRAGRVDQGDLGVVALAAKDDARQEVLEEFIGASVGELNSTLIEMVQTAAEAALCCVWNRCRISPVGPHLYNTWLTPTVRSAITSSLQRRSSRFSEAPLASSRYARATGDGRIGWWKVCTPMLRESRESR